MSDQSPWWAQDRLSPGPFEETAVLPDPGPTVVGHPDAERPARTGARENDLVAPRHPLRHPIVPFVAIAVVSTLVGTLLAIWNTAPEPVSPTATAAVQERAVPRDQISAKASSTQRSEGSTTYSVDNTLDGDPTTAWNSDSRADGLGPGMVLEYTFATPQDLRGITIRNGYQKTVSRHGADLDLFSANERVKELQVTTATGSWTWALPDSREPQSFDRAFGRTTSVRLEIRAVYEDGEFQDLAISDVDFRAATA